MLVNGVLTKMAEKQRLCKGDTKVKCRDRNIPEHLRTFEKHNVDNHWQHVKIQIRSKK